MNPADAFRLENEAGDLMSMGADPRRVLAVLAPFPEHPRTRAQSLRASAWLALARREGPSDAVEGCLRTAFEAALADHRDNPSIYAPDLFDGASSENDMITVGIGSPFAAWFEYLVTFGRFAEAEAARDRVMPVLGPSFFAKPRPPIRKLVEALASMAKPDLFERALEPEFLPRELGELRVSRHEGPLPRGVPGVLEVICVALPVPLFTGEPLWIAFARVAGTEKVRVFTLDWFGEEWLARPAAWTSRAYLGAREYGPEVTPDAAPRPDLGPGSPYWAPFMAFIGVELMNACLEAAPRHAPSAYVPTSFPPSLLRAPVPSLVPRSWPPPPPPPRARRKRSNAGRMALTVLGALAVALVAGFGGWKLESLRASHH